MASQMTEVRLLSVPLESNYKHTIFFTDETKQLEYFLSSTVFYGDNFSYQRKEGYIRYDKCFDDISHCNYLMYQNPTTNKWYYAFITDMVYKSDDVTWIYFELDVIQTYMFSATIRPSFVEREHVKDDTIGNHTVPENLECGEYVSSFYGYDSNLTNLSVVVGVTETPESGLQGGARYNGIFSGLSYYAFPNDEKGLIDLIDFFGRYDNSSKTTTEAIECMFLAPSFLCETKSETTIPDSADSVIGSEEVKSYKIELDKGGILEGEGGTLEGEGYKPRNNKLHCYPYKYLYLDNNNGGSAIYQYEHFSGDTITLNIQGALTPGCSIRVVPWHYKGVFENDSEGLNLGKFPICNWTTDVFTNWLTQNSVNIGISMVTGLGQIVGGTLATVGTGGVGGAIGGGQIVSGVSTIANQLAQIHQMSFTPPQSHGNINCGDVVTASHKNTLTIYGMKIKDEYMKIIDGFFDMYGYKVNTVKVPEMNHRENYWYTKTIDVSIDCRAPQKDVEKIKECFNRGITFWRNPNEIGNYSISNNII